MIYFLIYILLTKICVVLDPVTNNVIAFTVTAITKISRKNSRLILMLYFNEQIV